VYVTEIRCNASIVSWGYQVADPTLAAILPSSPLSFFGGRGGEGGAEREIECVCVFVCVREREFMLARVRV